MKKKVCVTAAAALLLISGTTIPAAAESSQKIRIIVENNVFSTENGADWSGALVDEWIAVDSDSTAASAFLSALEAHGYTQSGAEFDYITEINGLSGEDGGSMGCWMISLDDWFTDEALSAYTISSGKLESGDTVRFSYSLSWGGDLGYDWSGTDTSLASVTINGGSTDTDFASDKYEYTLTADEGSSEISFYPRAVNPYYRVKIYKNTYTPSEAGTDIKFDEPITVEDGDVIIIGVANEAWMQSNYNQATESVYKFSVNKPVTVDTAVQAAESAINAIGTVTSESGKAIAEARKAYDSLTSEQKSKVTNYQVLEDAEKAFAALTPDIEKVNLEALREEYINAAAKLPVYGNEWDVINLARMGLLTKEAGESYINSLKSTLDETGSAKLSATRSTANSGAVTALTAMGIDASDFYGYDLVQPLSDLEFVSAQGVNGNIYALIALDSHNYQLPSGSSTTRDALIEAILSAQEDDGGWTIDTWSGTDDGSDADMTAMALQALAPYKNDLKVNAAIDKALAFLASVQNENGCFRSYGSYDCESSAQVINALCAFGIDPANDSRFIKNSADSCIGMMRFFNESDKGFSHFENGASNYLSTYQAYSAVASVYRFNNKMTSLFDMSDVTLKKLTADDPSQSSGDISSNNDNSLPSLSPSTDNTVNTGEGTDLYFFAAAAVIISALSAAVFVRRRKNQNVK